MIEKKPAVDRLDEILALPGIDMVQWGGADYSLSARRPGMARDPVIESCRRRGIPARAEIRTTDEAQSYLDLGLAHFSLGDALRYHLERVPAALHAKGNPL